MHIDFSSLQMKSEGDVEAKLIVPLLTGVNYLNVPSQNFFSKDYLAPVQIDKGSKTQGGYYPDFSVWVNAFPICVIEAKAPGVAVENGYQEAALYAQQRNRRYPKNVNPSRFIIASNGERILCGEWDSAPDIDLLVKDLFDGGSALKQITDAMSIGTFKNHAADCLARTRVKGADRAFSRVGGPALLNAKKPLNTFASELSPVLTRYFTSQGADVREISEKAYVSSHEITEYDRVLEALLADRASLKKDSIIEQIQTSRRRELHVERAINTFSVNRPKEGHLQIIQGAVGAGKSLFIRRYQQVLQSTELQARTRWAWVNFNDLPPDLKGAEAWLCRAFVDSFEEENPSLQMSDGDVLRGLFSRQIQRRKSIYDDVAKSNPESAARMRGEDLIKWQDDPIETARGIGNYVMGVRHNEILVAVMDNVDRQSLATQLDAFQLSLWFMDLTKAFIILQMRDETYERFKTKPPLDTFRTGIAFHISPPRFIDVVKKRLDLATQYLTENSSAKQSYTLPSGMRITMPNSQLGDFLHHLYVELFDNRQNMARVLESLAGLNVRQALEMFVSIITSGHLGEDQITSSVKGASTIKITEDNILRILMRSDFRYFSDGSGYITNIFNMDPNNNKPSNLLYCEILFYLSDNRKTVGELGIEGYFAVERVCFELQKMGYDPDDTFKACKLLLGRYLISADHMDNVSLAHADCIKINASGYIHLRVLSEQVEYLFGILPSTRISDVGLVDLIVDVVRRENTAGEVSLDTKIMLIRNMHKYLVKQAKLQHTASGLGGEESKFMPGAQYCISQIKNVLDAYDQKVDIRAIGGRNIID